METVCGKKKRSDEDSKEKNKRKRGKNLQRWNKETVKKDGEK